MINVVLTQRAEQDRNEISFYRWKNLPSGTDDEVKAAYRIIKAEQAKVDRALDQLRRLPESARFPFVIMISAFQSVTIAQSPPVRGLLQSIVNGLTNHQPESSAA